MVIVVDLIGDTQDRTVPMTDTQLPLWVKTLTLI